MRRKVIFLCLKADNWITELLLLLEESYQSLEIMGNSTK